MWRHDGGRRCHKCMLCLVSKGRRVVFTYFCWLETSHTSRRTTDSRLALQYVTSQQLEQLGSARLVHDTWSPQRVRCRVAPRTVERASRLEGKNFKTSISAEVSTMEAYLDPRVHSSPCAAWCFQKMQHYCDNSSVAPDLRPDRLTRHLRDH
jgi:hypothetical protein